ncbi:MAG: metallophosphoesterase [Parcubacteria group bacterium]|jgi:predicted MPP superfamily phosphohydrolase
MDESIITEKKSRKAKFLPLLLILPVLVLIFFSQYPKNFGTFFGIKEEQKTTLTEVQSVQEVQTQPEIKKEENNTIPEEPTQEEDAKKESPKEEVPRPDLTIGIIADAHAGQKHGFSLLNLAVSTLRNQVQPDIVVDLGDLIESRVDYKEISKKSAEADYKKASGIIASSFQTYHVVGNHELLSMSKDNVENLIGRKNRYVANAKGYQIIVLDANYTDEEMHIDAKHDDSFIYTGTLTSGALDWLESRLKESSKNIIFIHHPIWNLVNKNEVLKILRKNQDRIIMTANGHKHPATLGVIEFGGINNYNIPSAYHQRTIAVVKINGNSAKVSTKKY